MAGSSQQLGAFQSEREAYLVSRVLDRDSRAFHELYQSYRPRLTRFLVNLVRRPSLVEEVLNDTMMVVWNRLEGFKGDSKLSTWVFAIAYRKAMKAVQRNDEPVESTEQAASANEAPGPEESANHQQTQKALKRALDKLSANHRIVVDLTYFHELGYREIAQIMECPVDTVKTRMFHARRQLKQILAGEKSDWL